MIDTIKCQCKFILIGNKNDIISSYNYQHSFSYKTHGLQWHTLDSMSIYKLKCYDNIKIIVEIKIIEAFDLNDDKIPKNKWINYDIV